MVDELAVADDILKIADKAELEEHHRVDALPAAFAIISLGKRIQKIKIYRTL